MYLLSNSTYVAALVSAPPEGHRREGRPEPDVPLRDVRLGHQRELVLDAARGGGGRAAGRRRRRASTATRTRRRSSSIRAPGEQVVDHDDEPRHGRAEVQPRVPRAGHGRRPTSPRPRRSSRPTTRARRSRRRATSSSRRRRRTTPQPALLALINSATTSHRRRGRGVSTHRGIEARDLRPRSRPRPRRGSRCASSSRTPPTPAQSHRGERARRPPAARSSATSTAAAGARHPREGHRRRRRHARSSARRTSSGGLARVQPRARRLLHRRRARSPRSPRPSAPTSPAGRPTTDAVNEERVPFGATGIVVSRLGLGCGARARPG